MGLMPVLCDSEKKNRNEREKTSKIERARRNVCSGSDGIDVDETDRPVNK